MQTLSYGYLLPEDGDKGNVFFPGLEDDIQQLNDHNHNGLNSAKLTAASSVVVTQSISNAGWAAHGAFGLYRQLVTLTGGLQYDEVEIGMRDTATKNILFLSIEKVSATTYYVYINDNTLNLTAVYTS